MIILKDADIGRAVRAAVWGSFANSGQVCVGVQRIMVQRGIYKEFRDRYVEEVKKLKLGDGWEDPDVHNDSPATRQKALRMGENILQYVFTN